MKKYTKKEIKELLKQRDELNSIINNYCELEEYNIFKNRTNYVGKCYKSKYKNKFYKVISQYSSNDTRITCAVIDLEEISINYDFNHYSMKVDFPNIHVNDPNFIYIEDVFAFSDHARFFDDVNEITNIDFDRALSIKFYQIKNELNTIHKAINSFVENYKQRYLKVGDNNE